MECEYFYVIILSYRREKRFYERVQGMKLLRFIVKGINLYQEDVLEMEFINQQRVCSLDLDEEVSHLFNRVYLKNIIGCIGINAAGKTTTLNMVSFILKFYLGKQKLDVQSFKGILDNFKEKVEIEAYFYDKTEGQIVKIITELTTQEEYELKILEEKIFFKRISQGINKKTIYDFNQEPKITRTELPEDGKQFLLEDVSIFKAVYHNKVIVKDTLLSTNLNLMSLMDINETAFLTEILQYLDSSIEYLKEIKSGKKLNLYELKFYNQDPKVYSLIDLQEVISSGTIKGIKIFSTALEILVEGGYMIIDEIENHLNKSIVISLIELFKSSVNKNKATLIFTTHYTEIIDNFKRKDILYVVQKDGRQIAITNLASKDIRNDVSLSALYLNSKLDNLSTSPKYRSYIHLKRAIKEQVYSKDD